jgi:omega-amidase
MKAFCIQHDIVWENKAATHERVRNLLRGADFPRGSLLVLAEMFSTGFSMNVPAIAEGEARESERFLAELAEERSCYVLGGVVTERDGKGRNESVTFDPSGREVVRYCKMHPFTLGGELDNYERGPGTITFQWHDCTVAPFICYDLRFPEALRASVKQGAQLYTVIASWPVARIDHWVALLKARAIENQAYVVGVNRMGIDPKFTYTGRSMILAPSGEVLADAGGDEGIVGAEIDMEFLRTYREQLPFLKDMRG